MADFKPINDIRETVLVCTRVTCNGSPLVIIVSVILCCFDDTCTPGTSVYFNASTLLRTIQVHLDVRLSIEEFVKKASEYLKLDAEYLNVSGVLFFEFFLNGSLYVCY
ncbi:unnamed protein product [Trichobilharzia regenti]|nr:unnamed protein product [Trichobilharzia regenti]